MGFFDDAALVEAICAGDDDAAAVFCRRFRPRVLALVRGRRIPSQDCDAVIQDVLATALDQIGRQRFRGDSRLGTWLYAIATGKVADYWRAAVPAKQFVQLDQVPAVSTRIRVECHPDDMIAVQDVLKRLPPEDRLVLWLHDAEGATLEEIGRRIGRRKSAVAERLAHARERFRLAFGEGTGKNPPKPRLKE